MVTYAAICGDYVKVGRTRNASGRLRGLQIGNPLPISLYGVVDGNSERECHAYLELCGIERVSGEWFRDGVTTRAALAGCGIWPLGFILPIDSDRQWSGEI